jgi:hypothetical protein
MARPKRPPRARTVTRKAARASDKLTEARMKLLDLEPGGSPERPLEVGTPAVIETKARALPCPRCEEPFELVAHEAHTRGGRRLRETKLRCRVCGLTRSLWFHVSEPS